MNEAPVTQFPILYLLDRPAPSETYIRREIEQLQRKNWPIRICTLQRGSSPLKFSFFACPSGYRVRLLSVALSKVLSELMHRPWFALRLFWRIPQLGPVVWEVLEDKCELVHAHYAGLAAAFAEILAETVHIPWTCTVHARDVFEIGRASCRERV